MKKYILMGGILLFAFILSASFSLAAISNGSFENGSNPGYFATLGAGNTNITNWTIDTMSVDYIGLYWQASDGDRSIDLNGNDNGSISQTIPTVVGKTYDVTFDLSGNPENISDTGHIYYSPPNKVVIVSATGSSPQEFSFDTSIKQNTLADMEWESNIYTFIATTTSTTLTFASKYDGAFGPALDNVEVIEEFIRTAEITSPTENEVVSGLVSFDATLNDKDGNDSVQWAVREGTCAAGVGTVWGNVDGRRDIFTWDGHSFQSTADTSSWNPGDYCFVFNPTESAGDTAIRETREFSIADTKAPLVTIESPEDGDVVSGIVHVFGTIAEDVAMGNYNIAVYPGDANFMDFIERLEQANVNPATIFNNQDIYQWDTTKYDDGEYLIRFAARDKAGNRDLTGDPYLGGDDSQHVIKVIVNNTPDNKDQCKNGGWDTFYSPEFKNQGDCVSWLQSSPNAKGNRKDN